MDEWATRVAAWERSGQSVVKFCKPRSWDPVRLRWWRWKLARRGGLDLHATSGASPARAMATPTFLRLVTSRHEGLDDPAATRASATRCELVLRDGRVLRFDDAVAPERLRSLADALEVGS